MKILSLIFLLLLKTCANSEEKAPDLHYANVITPKDAKTNETITVLLDGKDGSIDTGTVFVVKVSRLKDSYEFRTGVITKRDFKTQWYFDVKKDKLYGCFDYNNHPVLVYGEGADFFYSKTSQTIILDFIPNNSQTKIEPRPKDMPPIAFEPPVRIYLFKDGVMTFQKRGLFELLE
jgi:hypothetical protein